MATNIPTTTPQQPNNAIPQENTGPTPNELGLNNVIRIIQSTMSEVKQLTSTLKTQVTSMNQFKKQVYEINKDILKSQEDVKGYIHLLKTIIESSNIKIKFLDAQIKCSQQTIDELKLKIIHISKGEEASELASSEEIKKLKEKINELEENKKTLETQKKNSDVEKAEAHKNVQQIQNDAKELKIDLEKQLNELKSLMTGAGEGLVGGSNNPPAPTAKIVTPTPPNQSKGAPNAPPSLPKVATKLPLGPKYNPNELGNIASKMEQASKNRMGDLAKAKTKAKINPNDLVIQDKSKQKSTDYILKDLEKIKLNASTFFNKVSVFIEYTLKIKDVPALVNNLKFKEAVKDGSILLDFGIINNDLNEIYKDTKVFILGKPDKKNYFKAGKYFYYHSKNKESKFIDKIVMDKGVTHIFDNRNLFDNVKNNRRYVPFERTGKFRYDKSTDKQPEWQLKWCQNKETKKLKPMYYSIKGDYYVEKKPDGDIFADDNFAVEGPSCKCMTQDEKKKLQQSKGQAKMNLMQQMQQSASKRNEQQEAIRQAKQAKANLMPNFGKTLQGKVSERDARQDVRDAKAKARSKMNLLGQIQGNAGKDVMQAKSKAAAKAKLMPNFAKDIQGKVNQRDARQDVRDAKAKAKAKSNLMQSIKSKGKQQPKNSEGEIDLSINSDSIETPMLINYKFK